MSRIVNRGFTLIEIVVVVTIALVLGGVMIARYNTSRDKQRVLRGAELFATEMRKIQAKADAGELAGCGNKGLDYYELKTISECAATAEVAAVCADGTVAPTPQPSIAIPQNLGVLSSGGVRFLSQGRGARPAQDASTDLPMFFSIQGSAVCPEVVVSVNASGSVTTGECDDVPLICQ